ncbi:MAG TPA: hypothetical protein VGK87_01760 [Anaerolineae bacterium]
MLNVTGVLAVLDRGITINWDDGPTLHRITALVSYHTAEDTTIQNVRLYATMKLSEEPLAFVNEGDLKITWTWLEGNTDNGADPVFWLVQLAVTNQSDDEVYLDSLDVIRIDAELGGQFNLGASPDLWRCLREHNGDNADWESSADTGYLREQYLIVQPVTSNRTHPPALLVRVDADQQSDNGQLPVELQLDFSGAHFTLLAARNRAGSAHLAPGVTVVSSRFVIASGDDALELKRLQPI